MGFISKEIRRGATGLGLTLCAAFLGCAAAGLALAAFCVVMLEIYPVWLALLLTAALTGVMAGLVVLLQGRWVGGHAPSPSAEAPISLQQLPAPVLALLSNQAIRVVRRHPKTVLLGAAAVGLGVGLLAYLAGPEDGDEDEND
ncbi:MAG: hypothetical protein AB7G39_07775 [Alphaproteobacteria bacterium]